MTYTPANIFDVRGKRLPTKAGGFVVASTRSTGGGWNVYSETPPSPDDYSDAGMLPLRLLAENVDVWAACRILNETVAE